MNERITPWYGAWPPMLKGGEIDMASRTQWERWKIPLISGLGIIIGVILLLFCFEYMKESIWEYVVESLAIAIIIAGILGLTIDRLFRQQFAEDAFRASIGYILPNELKGEMEWIYKCHIICTEHIQRFELLRIDDETCAIRVNTQRTLRNVGSNVESIKLGVGIDEWFHNTGSSRIISCGYNKEGERISEDGDTIGGRKSQSAIFALENEISTAPGEEITTWHEVEEIKRTNDVMSWNFSCPTRNPLVTVNSYEGIDFNVSFGYRVPSDQLGHDTYRLTGTLLPGQTISIRWWKKEDLSKWLCEDKKVNKAVK